MKNRRCDADGLTSQAHTHYSKRDPGKKEGGCGFMRREIQEHIWEKLSDEWLAKNVSGDGEYALHHDESCVCENGKIGKEKKAAASKKKKDFYETEEKKQKKKYYREKNKAKHALIKKVRVEMTKETIARLINML